MPEDQINVDVKSSSDKAKRKKFNKVICISLTTIFVCLSCVFGYNAYKDYKEHKDARDTWNEVREIVQNTSSDKSNDNSSIPDHHIVDTDELMGIETDPLAEPEEETDPYLLDRLDIESLKAINSDTASWLKVPGTSVDYAVMQEPKYPTEASTPKYLYASIYNRYLVSGSLFIPSIYKDDVGLPDLAHTIIYGHNMKDGTMFSELLKYKSEEFYGENPYFYLYYTDRTERYQICSVAHINSWSNLYNIPYQLGTSEYESMLQELRDISYYDTGVPKFNYFIPSVTLSTCDWNNRDRNGRLVITGMLDKTLYWD